MNEFQKAIALADKYAKAGIKLTEAERNLLRYLAKKANAQACRYCLMSVVSSKVVITNKEQEINK